MATKLVDCKTCNGKAIVAIDHQPSQTDACNLCVEKLAICNKCESTSDTNLICDGCGLFGVLCLSCAGLSDVPTAAWFCSTGCSERNVNAPKRKRTRPDTSRLERIGKLWEQRCEHKDIQQKIESSTNAQMERVKARKIECDEAISKAEVQKQVWSDAHAIAEKHRSTYVGLNDIAIALAKEYDTAKDNLERHEEALIKTHSILEELKNQLNALRKTP